MTLTTSFQKIATGSSKTYGYATGYLELWAKYNSQSIENNTSNVTVELRLVVSGGYIGNYQATYWGISGSLSNSGNLGSGDYRSRTVGSATGDITHNSDGTKSVSFSGYFNPTAWGYEMDVSGSADLPTIPRASDITCTDGYIGDTLTISIDRKVESFTDTLTYDIGGLTGTIATKTSNESVSFDTSGLKSSIYALIPNDTTIQGTIYCSTYNGDTQIGNTQSTTFSLNAKESECLPTLSYTAVETDEDVIEILGTNQLLIKGVTKPKITVTATPKYSATISSYGIDLNGYYVTTNEYTFDSLTGSSLKYQQQIVEDIQKSKTKH